MFIEQIRIRHNEVRLDLDPSAILFATPLLPHHQLPHYLVATLPIKIGHGAWHRAERPRKEATEAPQKTDQDAARHANNLCVPAGWLL